MQKQKIAKSSIIHPREVFDSEPDFTQWLSDNLDYLEDILGLSFEEAKPEEDVGDFSCDIVAKLSDSDDKAIFENQFERTDHNHLGKIITYGAGKDAKCVVWLSPEFRDEHIAALEWLNQNTTSEKISFFGVQLQFIRIGDSSTAPNFSIVVKPNDWTNKIREFGEVSDVKKARYKLFEDIIEEYSKIESAWTKVKPVFRHYLRCDRQMKIYRFTWEHYTSQDTVGISVHIKTGDSSMDKKIYDELHEKKKEMEEFVDDLQWTSPKTQYYISTYKELSRDLETLQPDEYSAIVVWMANTMKKMIDLINKFGKKYSQN